MLTPIRVRGKNKRDQSRKKQKHAEFSSSAKDEPKPRTGRPRNSKRLATQSVITDDHGAANTVATYPHQLSALEKLPTELLQTIFLQSINLNLPLSSLHLGSVLASPHLRRELVIHAFADHAEHEPLLYAEFQSGLLRQKWLTYNLLQHCQKTHFLRLAIRVLQKYSGAVAQDVYRGNMAKLTEAFDNYYSLSHRISMKLDPLRYPSTGDFPPPPDSSSRDIVFAGTDYEGVAFSIVLDNEGSCMEVFTPWVADPENKFWPKDYFLYKHEKYPRIIHSMFSAGSMKDCQIPEKLLHGPWTNERGYFLRLLLDAEAKLDWLGSTSGEVALQGFEDAIREDNSNAISILRTVGTWESDVLKEARLNHVQQCREDIETGKLTLEVLTNPHASWRMPASKIRFESATVGVVSSTKHLKIAVLEKTPNLKTLQALLGGDASTDIDCDDTELVEWALQKRAESRDLPVDIAGSNIGDWLLDTLEVIRKKK
ncbi:hypothetical protein MMC26_004604 [Xylographa opegraphella]|nr:hypothetical protein [Xylographa opegraphella]